MCQKYPDLIYGAGYYQHKTSLRKLDESIHGQFVHRVWLKIKPQEYGPQVSVPQSRVRGMDFMDQTAQKPSKCTQSIHLCTRKPTKPDLLNPQNLTPLGTCWATPRPTGSAKALRSGPAWSPGAWAKQKDTSGGKKTRQAPSSKRNSPTKHLQSVVGPFSSPYKKWQNI